MKLAFTFDTGFLFPNTTWRDPSRVYKHSREISVPQGQFRGKVRPSGDMLLMNLLNEMNLFYQVDVGFCLVSCTWNNKARRRHWHKGYCYMYKMHHFGDPFLDSPFIRRVTRTNLCLLWMAWSGALLKRLQHGPRSKSAPLIRHFRC